MLSKMLSHSVLQMLIEKLMLEIMPNSVELFKKNDKIHYKALDICN